MSCLLGSLGAPPSTYKMTKMTRYAKVKSNWYQNEARSKTWSILRASFSTPRVKSRRPSSRRGESARKQEGVVSRGESAGSKKAHITRHPTIRPWPCTSCLSLAVGSKTIMKMSILTMNKACLLLLMAARSCSSFFAPPDNCGASYRGRYDRQFEVRVRYGGRCIGSRHSPSALGKCHSPLRITPVEQLDLRPAT